MIIYDLVHVLSPLHRPGRSFTSFLKNLAEAHPATTPVASSWNTSCVPAAGGGTVCVPVVSEGTCPPGHTLAWTSCLSCCPKGHGKREGSLGPQSSAARHCSRSLCRPRPPTVTPAGSAQRAPTGPPWMRRPSCLPSLSGGPLGRGMAATEPGEGTVRESPPNHKATLSLPFRPPSPA